LTTIAISCPDDVLISLKENASEFAADVRMAAAAKFYELGRLSSGRAAELAGLPRVVFLRRLSEFGVSVFDLDAQQIEEDLANA